MGYPGVTELGMCNFAVGRWVAGILVIVCAGWCPASDRQVGSLDKLLKSNFVEAGKIDDERLQLENKIHQLELRARTGQITSTSALQDIMMARAKLLEVYKSGENTDKFMQNWQWLHDRIITDELYASEDFYEPVGEFLHYSSYSLWGGSQFPKQETVRMARQSREVYRLFVPTLKQIFEDDREALQYFELCDVNLLQIECHALAPSGTIRRSDVERMVERFRYLQDTELFESNLADHFFSYYSYFKILANYYCETGNTTAWRSLIEDGDRFLSRVKANGKSYRDIQPTILYQKICYFYETGDLDKVVSLKESLNIPDAWPSDAGLQYMEATLTCLDMIAYSSNHTSRTQEANDLYRKCVALGSAGEKISREVGESLHFSDRFFGLIGLWWTTEDEEEARKVRGEIDSLIVQMQRDESGMSDYVYPSIYDHYLTRWARGEMTTDTLSKAVMALRIPKREFVANSSFAYMQDMRSVLVDGSRDNVIGRIKHLEKLPTSTFISNEFKRYVLSLFLPAGDPVRVECANRLRERGLNPDLFY